MFICNPQYKALGNEQIVHTLNGVNKEVEIKLISTSKVTKNTK